MFEILQLFPASSKLLFPGNTGRYSVWKKTTVFKIMDDTKCLIWNEKNGNRVGDPREGKKQNNEHQIQQDKASCWIQENAVHQNERRLKRTWRTGQWHTQTDTKRWSQAEESRRCAQRTRQVCRYCTFFLFWTNFWAVCQAWNKADSRVMG